MSNTNNSNRVCQILKIEKPVIQGPMFWLTNAKLFASVEERKRVPQNTPSAPRANAALNVLLSVIPPAAVTGIFTESTIRGTIENVPIL